MTGHPRDLTELLEESQDLQSDALATTRTSLDDLVEASLDGPSTYDQADALENRRFADAHRRSLQRSIGTTTLLGAAGGGLLVALLASPALATTSTFLCAESTIPTHASFKCA